MVWFLGVIVRESGRSGISRDLTIQISRKLLDAPLWRSMTRAILGATA
jgi:hypothetical protein